MKYTTPTCFFGFQKKWGGSSGCHILAQRWYMAHPFIFDVRTYIYIHTCMQPGPGETMINQNFLAEIFLGVVWGTHPWGHPPFLKYFSFDLPPLPPLKGGIPIHTYIHYITLHYITLHYIPTYIHTYVPTYLPTYLHTYIHTHIHTYTHTHIHIHIYIYTYTYIYIHIHTYTYINIHIHIYIYTHTYTYIYIHIHTYT